jgi:phage/plasmid primase-like uncharacterized protein
VEVDVTPHEIEVGFAQAIADAGIGDTLIPADGKLHRFKVPTDKGRQRTGWAMLHADGVPSGVAGDWRTGERITWKPDNMKVSVEDRRKLANLQRRRETDREEIQRRAAAKAVALYDRLPAAPGDHPYLTRKQVAPGPCRITSGGALAVPVHDLETGQIISLQFIQPDGEKRFLAGGRTAGGYCILGDDDVTMVICEGYATGASIKAATGWAVVVAFNAGNLLAVAKAMRKKHSEREIVIAADNDSETLGNPGMSKATEAAKVADAKLVVPPAPGDFNDFHIERGIDAATMVFDMSETEETKETDDQVVARLAKLTPIEFDRQKKADADALGCTVGTLAQMVKAARKPNATPAPELTTEDLAASAKDIIASEAVLDLFAADWRNVVAGEQRNAKTLYLVATSRLFAKTMHAAIKGPSSAGKSEIRSRVLQFFPPESVVAFTSLSEKALLYFEDDFAHKILSMGEAAGTEEQSFQDYLLRELMSEGLLRYPTVEKIGGELQTRVIEKQGPVAFMVTTTRRKLHPENETRMLSLDIDDSEAQTRAVLIKVAEVEGLNVSADVVDYGRWRDYQRWLEAGERAVVVPFAVALSHSIPPRSVRLRRDLGQVIRAIKAHALLHRVHRARDDRGCIVADIAHDYTVVRDLMHDLLAETSEVKIKDSIVETINAVSELTKDLASDDGASAKSVSRLLKLDKSTASRRLRSAEDGGFVTNLETRKGRPGRYRTTDESIDVEQMLPTPEALKSSSVVGPLQPPQPATKRENDLAAQRDSGCNSGCTPLATTKNGGNPGKTEVWLHGCTVAAEGADDEDLEYEREERLAIQNEPALSEETQAANTLLDDIPAAFRRPPST